MNLFILPSSIPHAPPSQIFLLLNQTSHSLNLRLFHFSKYQPAPALPGRVSSSVFPAPPGYFIFFPHRCALHPAPVSRNPESKTHCCYPCSRPFLLPKTQKNSGKLFACRCLCVGVNLSSQAVSSQVLSAPVSLTSVFDMGTGGPSL